MGNAMSKSTGMSQCKENKIMENVMSAGLFERPRCEQGGFQTTPEDSTGCSVLIYIAHYRALAILVHKVFAASFHSTWLKIVSS